MAEVFKRAGGKKLEKFLALNEVVQDELEDSMNQIAGRASALLAMHRFDDHAAIETARGKVDRYVTLTDERGQKAAMSIEYGRQPSERDRGMDGLFILHQAANLPKKGT